MSLHKSYTEKEPKTEKRLRITLAVLYFIQVILTTFPFMWGQTSDGSFNQLTAFETVVQIGGYNSPEAIKLAILCSAFVIFPIIAFFFCVLDKKSNVKNFVSAACCVACVCLITFGIGTLIAIGAVIAIILYIIILFLTAQSFQASAISKNANKNNQ